MAKGTVAEYLRKEEECRHQAEASYRREVKVQWLRLATDWHALAENAKRAEAGHLSRIL